MAVMAVMGLRSELCLHTGQNHGAEAPSLPARLLGLPYLFSPLETG